MSLIVLVTIVGMTSLMGLTMAGVMYARIQSAQKALDTRFAFVTSNYGRATIDGERMRQRIEPKTSKALKAIGKIIGFKADEPYLYSVKWYVVVAAAIGPARLACWIIEGWTGPVSIALLPVMWILLCRVAFGWFESRYTLKLLKQFPDALGMIVRAVRVGIPVNVSIQSVAEESPPETAREFARAGEQLAIGSSVEDAVSEMAKHSRIAEYRFFATALSLQSQTGGGLSETLENLAEVIRKRVAMRARGEALSGEAKASAGILAALPVVTGLAMLVIAPQYGKMLFEDHGGRKLLALAIGLELTGGFVMRNMIRKALS